MNKRRRFKAKRNRRIRMLRAQFQYPLSYGSNIYAVRASAFKKLREIAAWG